MRKRLGYKLHLDRLDYAKKLSNSKCAFIRTVKIPLSKSTNSGLNDFVLNNLENDFANKIKKDYESLYGSFNITTYMNNEHINEKIYSLKDFWVDCLKQGVIMVRTASDMSDIVKQLEGISDVDNMQKQLIKNTNYDFWQVIKFNELKKTILKPKTFKPPKNVSGVFIKSKEGDTRTEYEIQKHSSRLKSIIDGEKGEERDKILLQEFGIQRSIYQAKETKNFYLLPDLDPETMQDKSPIDLIDYINEYLVNAKLVDDSKTSKQSDLVKSFVGVGDNQEGLSTIFGKEIFKLLQESRIDEIKNIIIGMSPSIWEGNEQELIRRLSFLAHQRKKLPLKPELVDDWSKYRTDFGRLIASWISNSFRQDKEIKKHLFGKPDKDDFKVLKNLISYLEELNNDNVKQSILNERDYMPFSGNNKRIQYVKSLAEEMNDILQNLPPNGKTYNNLLENYIQIAKKLKKELEQDYKSDPKYEDKFFNKCDTKAEQSKLKSNSKKFNNKYNDLLNQPPTHIDDLNNLIKNMKEKSKEIKNNSTKLDDKEREEYEYKIKFIQNLAEQMQYLLQELPNGLSNNKIEVERLMVYRQMLSNLKEELNLVYQGEEGVYDLSIKSKEQEDKTANQIYLKLFANLPKPPSFLGDTKIQKEGIYDKYFTSLIRVQHGITLINKLHELEENQLQQINWQDYCIQGKSGEDDYGIRVLRFLQGMLMLLRTIHDSQSVVAKQILMSTVNYVIQDDIDDILKDKSKNYDYIYRSSYSNQSNGSQMSLNFRILNINKSASEKLIDKIPDILQLCKINWQKYKDTSYINEWVHFIEIEKRCIGLIAQTCDISSFKNELLNNDELKKHFPMIDITFTIFSKDEWGSDKVIGTVLNRAIFSELSGTISRMTMKKVITRYVVQPMQSEDSFPLFLDYSNYLQKRNKRQSYYIYYPDSNTDFSKGYFRIYNNYTDKKLDSRRKFLNSDNILYDNKESANSDRLLQLYSSKYQIQFLDNSVFGKWRMFNPKLLSYSFIYEETCNVEWKLDEVIINDEDAEKRLFVSMPIEFASYPEEEFNNVFNEFLGIDIGEYGVATYSLKIKSDKNDQRNHCRYKSLPMPETSFIYESSQKKIRDGISLNKKKQKIGTFTMPNTYLKRLRDNATTKIRNRIHNLIIGKNRVIEGEELSTFHPIKPVYEKEISIFELGAGKISKIYNSLKRADTNDSYSSAAGRLERKLIWGHNSLMVGHNIQAYATSYCCSGCHKSIYTLFDFNEIQQKLHPVRILEYDQYQMPTMFLVRIKDDELYGYVKNKTDKEVLKKHNALNYKNLMTAFRNYARPSLDVFARIEDKPDCLKILDDPNAKKLLQYFGGNSMIFRCPFKDCEKRYSDADIQASMWIALKGFLDTYGDAGDTKKPKKPLCDAINQEWTKLTKSDKISRLLKYAEELNIPHVELNLNKRLYFLSTKRRKSILNKINKV